MKWRKTWMGQRKEGGAHSILLRSCFGPFPPPLHLPYLSPRSFPPPPSFPPKIAKKVGASRRQTLSLPWLFVPGLSIFLPLLLSPSAVFGRSTRVFLEVPKALLSQRRRETNFWPLSYATHFLLRVAYCSCPAKKILLSLHD